MECLKKVLPLVITAILIFSCDHEEEPLVSTLKGDLQSSIVLPLQENTCITSAFGWRKRGFHNGIDLRTERNGLRTVFAIASGKVVSSNGDQNEHSGEYIKIFHSELGVYSVYAHLSSKFVSVGRVVNKGEAIGVAGDTGRTSGAHLHFGMKSFENKFIDPEEWLYNNSVYVGRCE